MNVLVACEMSGVVREAFRARGHFAVSCDLEPTLIPGNHVEGDVRPLLALGWDLMVAFPPCTHLASSGARWFAEKRADGRQQAAVKFVRTLMDAPIPKIAVENPIGVLSREIRKPDQIVEPFWFGDSARKGTCLWLKELPLLVPTLVVNEGECYRSPNGKRLPEWYSNATSLERSLTFPGIALAMAEQWG